MTIIIIILIFMFFSQYYCQFPEDFSSIDQLTYLDTTSEKEEVFIGSYFQNSFISTDVVYDYRNGIKLIKKNFISQTPCTLSSSLSYSDNDDEHWDSNEDGKAYSPATSEVIKGFCSEPTGLSLDLKNILDGEEFYFEKEYGITYIFYIWIENTNNDDINIYCSGNSNPSFSFVLSSTGVYQFAIRYENSSNTNTFSYNDISFQCAQMELTITSNNIFYFKRLKLNMEINKKMLSEVKCSEQVKCPFSYYCDKNTKQCKKCLGNYANCTDQTSFSACGRFTQQWKNDDNDNKICKGDYYNLQYLDEMIYNITPPIKSNAASISFWLFTTKDLNGNPNIYHITLEDFFVVTIIPGDSFYTIYVTGYEMYHEAYGTILKDITNKNDFINIMENSFPYNEWNIFKEVEKINRWINVIISYNRNLLRISMQIFYKKRYTEGSLDINDHIVSKILPGEYIYNNNNNLNESRLHFKKYYRNSETTHLNVKIYNNNNIGVFFKKIYVFATELLIPDFTEKLFGFQYIEFEKIFSTDNHLMPELILAAPFENIEVINNTFFIEYYIYDMTKTLNNLNNLNKKYLIINNEKAGDSLYTYSPGLYRLNLIHDKNKMFERSTVEEDKLIPISGCNNNELCYYDGNPYACQALGLIMPDSRECVQINDIINNDINRMLVPGINAEINQKGTLTNICYIDCKKKPGSLIDFECRSSSFSPIFDACVELSSDNLHYFYYSYFFKLPPIKFNLDTIYDNYTIQFNFLYETNSALRPKNKLKGKKLYIFYSDAFRIWHDYTMNYLGIEDNSGNSNKNLIPNFNTENENLITISVRKEDDVYKGKVFINGVKIYMPSFTAGRLSYILFCHNDTACPAGNSVFWTSGFYNQIKIYNLDIITTLSDNSFYDLYIYNNYYSYYNYNNGGQRFNSYPSSESIDMEADNIEYNKISGKFITNPYSDKDELQMFNYGIDQSSLLKNYNYINKKFEQKSCSSSKIMDCYGEPNIFSEEAKVCIYTLYFKYDTCQEFPNPLKK